MSRRMWIAAVAAWVAVVVAGSGLTWFAIARAGDQVTGRPGTSATQPAYVGTVGPAPTAAPTRRHPHPTPATPSVAPTSSRPTATTTAAPSHTTPRPTRTATTAARTETRVWTGSAGSMTVSCTGSQAVLKGASPADGWAVEVGDSSGSEVEVTFRKDGNQVQVHAECAGGVPRFTVESDTSGPSTSETN